MTRPTVSIVLPTYNRADLVSAAVESVLSQTFTDFELLVIDDGSTDDTARQLAPYRHRIRYVYQENRGASAAQNRGVQLATGEWVSVIASDDRWHPEKLQQQLDAVRGLGLEFGACFTDCVYEGDPSLDGSAFEIARFTPSAAVGPLDDPLPHVLARHPIIYVQSLLVRRHLLDEIGGFDETLTVSEDTDLILQLTLKTRFCYVARALVTIDRTPARPRLIELFATRADAAFASTEHCYTKWLCLPLGEPMRRRISQDLANVYYDWALARAQRGCYREAWTTISKIHARGQAVHQIAGTLLFRAARKVSSGFTAS